MKKYTLFLFILAFVFGVFNNSVSAAGPYNDYTPGCTSTQGYSPTTGEKCVILVYSSLPLGCSSAGPYSSITGKLCGTDTAVVTCPAGDLFSSTTGQRCTAVAPTPISLSSDFGPVNYQPTTTPTLQSGALYASQPGTTVLNLFTPLYQRPAGLADQLMSTYGNKWDISASSRFGSRTTNQTNQLSVNNKFVRFESHQGDGVEYGSGVIYMPPNILMTAKASSQFTPGLITQFFQLRQGGMHFNESVSVYYRAIGSTIRRHLTTLHFSYDPSQDKIFLKETARSNEALVGTEGDPLDGAAGLSGPKLYDPNFEIGFVPSQLKTTENGFETSKLFISVPDSGYTSTSLEFEVNRGAVDYASELVLGPIVRMAP